MNHTIFIQILSPLLFLFQADTTNAAEGYKTHQRSKAG